MDSIKEENEKAVAKMKENYQNKLKQDSGMNLGEVIEFGLAIVDFQSEIKQFEGDEYRSLCHFLLSVVDTQEDGIGEQPRYKLITQYNWAMRNAKRDWNNRFEMGR